MSYRCTIQMPDLPEAYPMSTDSVLLSAFAGLHKGETVCDLGAGIGTLSMLLSERYPQCSFTGYELLPEAVAASGAVLRKNGFENIRILQQDLRCLPSDLPLYDAAVSNPPYFAAGSGARAAAAGRAAARSEDSLPLTGLCHAASRLLKYGGRFYLVHKPERLADLIPALRDAQLEPKVLRFVKKKADSLPSLLLLQCRKGGNPGLKYLPDLILQDPDGSASKEYKEIYGIED